MKVYRHGGTAVAVMLSAIVLDGSVRASAREDAASPTRQQVEAWQQAYMAALNAHDVDAVLRFYAKDVVRRRRGEIVATTRESLRAIREWEGPMRAHFSHEVVAVRGEWLTVRLLETNLLYDALDVKRPQVSRYRWRNGEILEMNSKEIRETGRTWADALPELEAWLAARPDAAATLRDGRLAFTAEGARALVPLLPEYRKQTDSARQRHERVMRHHIAALNRQDAGAHRWDFTVTGAGTDTLEMVVTDDAAVYDALGVGTRSHRARYRFQNGTIVETRTWDWTQKGRPYEGARDGFAGWLAKERPGAAPTPDLAREWRAARPCRMYHPSFNSSGSQIVFSSDCEGPWGIYVMEADGSLPRRVTPRDMDARLPNWSPDDARLVFQSNQGGNWDIYTIGVDGSGMMRLTEEASGESSGSFSPDGAHVMFASDRHDSLNDLFLVPAAGGEARRITRGAGTGFRSVWSPDGTHILYRASRPATSEQGRPGEFFRVRLDGSGESAVAGGQRHEYNQAYSPDGSRIAFDAHRTGGWESADGGWEIWVMNADGSNRQQLTQNSVNDWGPSWSPDGGTIAFLSGTNNIYDVHVMAADGSNVRRLTNWTR